jgi:hypothetical protein
LAKMLLELQLACRIKSDCYILDVIEVPLTYTVAWTVTLTSTDTLTCNVLEGVVSAFEVPVPVLMVPVIVLRELAFVLESVLCALIGTVFELPATSVV